MPERIATDLCVIGAGSAGLSVAAGAAQMGARTVLIERGLMGGDCLNFGCVPSKSLLAAAKAAFSWRRGLEPSTRACGERDRRHRAARFGGAFRGPRRSRHQGRGALYRSRHL